jgi:phosphoribosylanthranilate isomerase
MNRTRVKICGITSETQARDVCACGVDAIGLVFHAASPRCVDVDAAARICAAAAPLVTVVGLFVDAPEVTVREVLDRCPLDVLQFHGEEDAAYCSGFGRPYIKAIRMRPDIDIAAVIDEHKTARAFLFDAFQPGVAGGTGTSFDWRRLPELERPWLLAGGLDASNVGEAMEAAAPPAVDVSGGVESAPGIKDTALVRRFMAAVRAADQRMQKDAA